MAELYTVNGDDSHEGKAERVFAVAGLFGSEDDWDTTESAWLIRTGGKIFHAGDCEGDQRDFTGIDHKENQKLYKDLTQIIAQSKLCGFGAGIDVAGFREFFPDALEESSYHKCFFEVLITSENLPTFPFRRAKHNLSSTNESRPTTVPVNSING